MEWTFQATPAEDRFKNGFSANVQGVGTTKPDWYWNPRREAWEFFAPALHRFIDENLPSVNVPGVVVDGGAGVYREIAQQYVGLSTDRQKSVVWDGRRRKWVVVAPMDSSLPPTDPRAQAQAEYKRKVELLNGQLASGQIKTITLYEKLVQDLWEEYQHRV